ncbi:MAG TPA: dethiobiotin synthase [Solirubrobacteraceae bacterium]|jgi:dethiobiotin synthetase|nr:dethiobiotin synthase [Solirubrobacteraceae bacterium]
MRGCFVTGTDTGAGKTVVAAAVAASLRSRGHTVVACKPVLTGTVAEPPGESAWPADDELLGAATGRPPWAVAPLRFGPAVSPHLAAELAGEPIDPRRLVATVRRAAEGSDAVVVEGVGGLLVPLTSEGYSVRDLARELALPVIVAARAGLGTISHSLLTLEAARAGGLDVRAVVLTPWPEEPGRLERSNRETIRKLGSIAVHTLPLVAEPEPSELARAASEFPVESWLTAGSDRLAV